MRLVKQYTHGGAHSSEFTGPKNDLDRQNKAMEQILQSMTFQGDDKKRDQLGTMDLLNILGAAGGSDATRVNPYEPGTVEYSFFEDPSLKEQFPEEYEKANMQTDMPRSIIPYRDDDGNLRYKVLKSTDRKGRGRYQDVQNLTREQIQMLTPAELDNRQISQMQDYINNPRFGQSIIQYLLGIDEEEPDVKKFKPRSGVNINFGGKGQRGGKKGAGSRNLRIAQGGGIKNAFRNFCARMKRHPSCR